MNQDQRGASEHDRAAIDRYRYLVRTAPPEAVERAHEEAFARLTREQRQEALRSFSSAVPDYERPAGTADDARSLARVATRAEVRRPGTIARVLGSGGGPFAGSLLSSLAGAFLGTAIAHQLWGGMGGSAGEEGALAGEEEASAQGASGEEEEPEEDAGDASGDLADSYGEEFGDDFGTGI